jgi:hypothetical protein
VPAFQQLVNGVAERVEFALSGVDATMAALAASEASEVKGVALLLGVGAFDTDWQMAGTPIWLKRLTVDYLSIAQDPIRGPKDETIRAIKLSARSFLTGRRRPANSFYTDAEQQSRSAGDRFCERTGLYSAEVVKTWPRF